MKNPRNVVMKMIIAMTLSLLAFSVSTLAKPALAPPVLGVGSVGTDYIDINVTGGVPTGAPAGFSLQWMTLSDNLLFGWDGPNSDSHTCKASFSGNASGYTYNLASGQQVTVRVGKFNLSIPGGSTECPNVLDCDTTYVFRSFAHATNQFNRSAWSYLLSPVTTLACNVDHGCTYTQGYWKTHGPIPFGNNSNQWDVNNLYLGTVNYTDFQLLQIFQTSVGGNGLISLSHQLIAVKLNIANGADPTAINGAVAAADGIIGGLVVPPIGVDSLAPSVTSALTGTLDAYNNGFIGPGHCN